MTARLPPELFAFVLEHAARSLQNPRPFLVACSLLDHTFGQEAQRVLFKRYSRLRHPERVDEWLASPYSAATEDLMVWFPPPDSSASLRDLRCVSSDLNKQLKQVLERSSTILRLHLHLTKVVPPVCLSMADLRS
jgi:hypothetical protein